ncbi:hypothetical protein Ferp_0570 [Ferroglobus placidus DSM 10642]|uniref:RNA ligase domain-containing protein n=1 Tax=Ferroglobus placidus (strain DSM 10642 / AEDII12DO) TaxID=589924 RepID=D3S3B0_FERPA|nr:hypothetical protein [Ferroglobus placidus]ADC64743.1 hypothetical protein Ferp_0570 [Ferroglobus placidus DSM 10642]
MVEGTAIFTRKCCRTMTTKFGRVTVYMAHDEHMGKCLFEDGFVTPNMPKLHYAIDFSVRDDTLILKDSLSPKAREFQGGEAYVFEKRDGFNLLFYMYRGEVIPKTRMKPMATGKTAQVVTLPGFPREEVEELVRDGYIPIMEVWGTKIEELDIMHGPVNYRAVQEREGLPELNAEIIAIMRAESGERASNNSGNNNSGGSFSKDTLTLASSNSIYCYEFLPPDVMMETAESYGLKTAPLHDVVELSPENVKELMSWAEKVNEREVILEGFVAHCSIGTGYGMFKIKPYSIMAKDVITSKTIPRERIELEISKILLETDVEEIARNPGLYIEQLNDYLGEDFKLTKEMRKKARRVFAETIARELLRKNPDLTPEAAGRCGIHGMFIGFLRKQRGLAGVRAETGDKGLF